MKDEFCDYTALIADGDKEVDRLPPKVRCPKCGKRMKPKIDTCTGDFDMYCCIWAHFPRHKKPVGGKKFVRKERHGRFRSNTS